MLDGGYEPAKADAAADHIVTGISFLPEQQIEQLLAEAGFTNITRFYATGLFGGWICHAHEADPAPPG